MSAVINPIAGVQTPGSMVPATKTGIPGQTTQLPMTSGTMAAAQNTPLNTPGALPISGTVPVSTTATQGLVPGTAPTPVSISSGLSTQGGDNTLVGDFQNTYGKGTGTALADTLASLGTATNGAVSATNSAIEADAAKSQANISSGLAAAGISADSSTNALAQGDFASSLAQTVASTDSQMELSEENTLISALQGEGTAHGSDSSTWDNILGGISDAGQIAGSVASIAGLF